MVKSSKESSISGYIGSIEEETVSTSFTDIEQYVESGHSLLLKAKRQGRWWLLKGLTKDKAGSAIYLQMLRKEFEITNRMSHPWIVRSSELVRIGGEYAGTYIVMEWIDGMTLDRWMAKPHTSKQKHNILNQLLTALEYIHSQGIVHRDFKPENLMITHNGDYLKVIDFGLSDAAFFSILKQPAGTVGYMSPEQQSEAVADVRNDIYSLGKIIKKMGLGRSYDRVIRKCMGPIDNRYANIAELSDALVKARQSRRAFYMGLSVAGLMLAAALWIILREKEIAVDPATESTAIGQVVVTAVEPNDSARSDNAPNAEAKALSASAAREARKTESKENDNAKKVDEIIARGKAIIDAKGVELDAYLDTLSRKEYLNLKQFNAPKTAWKDYYYQDVIRQISAEQADRVYHALDLYTGKRYKRWNEQRDSLP